MWEVDAVNGEDRINKKKLKKQYQDLASKIRKLWKTYMNVDNGLCARKQWQTWRRSCQSWI